MSGDSTEFETHSVTQISIFKHYRMDVYDSKEEEVLAYLLSNRIVFERLCSVIIDSGKNVQTVLQDNPIMNQLNILPLENEGITRELRPFFVNYGQIKIHYDWKDITIIGGGAFNAIEQASQMDLDSHILSHTTDIDAVWWPYSIIGQQYIPVAIQTSPVYPAIDLEGKTVLRNHFDTYMASSFDETLRKQKEYSVTSTSPAIQYLANTYASTLLYKLNMLIVEDKIFQTTLKTVLAAHNLPINESKIKFSVENTANMPILETDSAEEKNNKSKRIRGSILSGSWSIIGYLDIVEYDLHIKLIDMSIHDFCSSQKSTKLKRAHFDITYSSGSNPNSILYIPLPKLYSNRDFTSIGIPVFSKLFEQQRIALQNRVQLYWSPYGKRMVSTKKIQAHHRRIQYLIDTINHIYKMKHLPFYQHLINLFQLYSYPSFYHKYLQNELFKSSEWIASCPIYTPPFPPCDENETDKHKLKDCAIYKCNIHPHNLEFQKLCREGKILDSFLCEGPYLFPNKYSPKRGFSKKTRKNKV